MFEIREMDAVNIKGDSSKPHHSTREKNIFLLILFCFQSLARNKAHESKSIRSHSNTNHKQAKRDSVQIATKGESMGFKAGRAISPTSKLIIKFLSEQITPQSVIEISDEVAAT
jgi:hypothetical protein